MVDSLTRAKRSWNMSRIKSGNTKPEKVVRSLLHAMGYRFRLHRKDLPGKPDVVLPKYKTVIFIHGCFWHRHDGCKNATMPKTNTEFWENKLSQNIDRDRKKQLNLERLGWKVIVIWECETEGFPKELATKLQRQISYPDIEGTYEDLLMVAEKKEGYGEKEDQTKKRG